jgi:hypothetical protein
VSSECKVSGFHFIASQVDNSATSFSRRIFVNDVSPHKFFRRAHFSSSFLKGGFFTAAGGANGNTSSPSQIGVPAKKASAIKIPKGFLLSNAPGFEQCVASLNFMTFSSLRRVVKDSNYFLQIELLRYFARYLRAQLNEWVLLLSKVGWKQY